MSILDTLERIVLEELITSARKDPKKARKLFLDSLKQFDELVAAEGEVDFAFVSKLSNLMMNLLPEDEGDRIREESNRVMAEQIIGELRKHSTKPEEYFKHEVKPCGCPVCKANDRQVHLAN